MHTSTSVGVVHDMGVFPSVLVGTDPYSIKLAVGRPEANRDLPEKRWENCPSAWGTFFRPDGACSVEKVILGQSMVVVRCAGCRT
jgi:hypothetical protein